MSEIPLQSGAAGFDAEGLETIKADLTTLAQVLAKPLLVQDSGGGDINANLAALGSVAPSIPPVYAPLDATNPGVLDIDNGTLVWDISNLEQVIG